jgi:sodium transport system permease protein
MSIVRKFWWSSALIVFRKEWRDALRDKRSLRLALLPAFYFVAIFVGGTLFTISTQQDYQVDGLVQIKLPVQGGEHLPELLDWLREQGVETVAVETDVYQQVQQGDHKFALIIPADIHQQKLRGENLTLWLVYNAANQQVHSRLQFIRGQIYAWSVRTGNLNLLARGIAPGVGAVVSLRENNVANDQQMGIYILGGLPMILLLSAFIASIGFSADMTAGERERRSLESLLITPVSSLSLILGKWLTSLLITFSVVILTLALLWLALATLPFNELGLRVDVRWPAIAAIFLVLMPVILIACALQLAVAIFARSFKDAQTYTGLLVFIPMVPGFYTLFNPGVYADWFLWVPVLGQQVIVRDLLLGGSLAGLTLASFWITASALTLVLLLLAAKQLRRAKIIYG